MITNAWDNFDPSLPYGVDLESIWVEERIEDDLILRYNIEAASIKWKTAHDIKELNQDHLVNWKE